MGPVVAHPAPPSVTGMAADVALAPPPSPLISLHPSTRGTSRPENTQIFFPHRCRCARHIHRTHSLLAPLLIGRGLWGRDSRPQAAVLRAAQPRQWWSWCSWGFPPFSSEATLAASCKPATQGRRPHDATHCSAARGPSRRAAAAELLPLKGGRVGPERPSPLVSRPPPHHRRTASAGPPSIVDSPCPVGPAGLGRLAHRRGRRAGCLPAGVRAGRRHCPARRPPPPTSAGAPSSTPPKN